MPAPPSGGNRDGRTRRRRFRGRSRCPGTRRRSGSSDPAPGWRRPSPATSRRGEPVGGHGLGVAAILHLELEASRVQRTVNLVLREAPQIPLAHSGGPELAGGLGTGIAPEAVREPNQFPLAPPSS